MSGSIKYGEYLDQWSGYKLRQKDSTPWSYRYPSTAHNPIHEVVLEMRHKEGLTDIITTLWVAFKCEKIVISYSLVVLFLYLIWSRISQPI